MDPFFTVPFPDKELVDHTLWQMAQLGIVIQQQKDLHTETPAIHGSSH